MSTAHGETLDQRALHARAILIDALDISVMNDEHLAQMVAGGVTAANACVAVHTNYQEAVERIADLREQLRTRWADRALQVWTAADVARAKREGKVGLIFGLQNTSPIEGDLRLVDALRCQGVRIVQLTYMTANLVGDGCLEPRNSGLTLYGKRVVRELNRLGMLIDLSHCGERTTLEAIEESEAPVAVTHACTRRLCGSPRNKTDVAMKGLAAAGGVMGITSLANFVSDDPADADLDTYLAHVEHAVDVMGIDHVGLGMDFVAFQPPDFVAPARWGGSQIPPDTYSGGPPLSTWPIPYARDVDDSTKFPNVTAGLLARGYSATDVEKILGLNFLRLFERVWSNER